jgi:hypothetical protein
MMAHAALDMPNLLAGPVTNGVNSTDLPGNSCHAGPGRRPVQATCRKFNDGEDFALLPNSNARLQPTAIGS